MIPLSLFLFYLRGGCTVEQILLRAIIENLEGRNVEYKYEPIGEGELWVNVRFEDGYEIDEIIEPQ